MDESLQEEEKVKHSIKKTDKTDKQIVLLESILVLCFPFFLMTGYNAAVPQDSALFPGACPGNKTDLNRAGCPLTVGSVCDRVLKDRIQTQDCSTYSALEQSMSQPFISLLQ